MERLVNELTKLPTIGPKTAQRLAFFLFKQPLEELKALSSAIMEIKEKIKYCSICSNITEEDPCSICRDEKRNHRIICVVERPSDVVAMEKTGLFNGVYHVLQGAISPLDGITPNDLKIKELLERLSCDKVDEVIIATNPNVEGEATSLYLKKLIQPLGISISRIAQGLPMGTDLEYADEVTLGKALEGRKKI
jgi:recombination protein RecR